MTTDLLVTLLGTGSPLPDPDRAGPSTLVSAGVSHYLVDAGRGVLMRLAAAGVAVPQLSAVLLTHLHSDHLTDLSDVITTRWVTGFAPAPLPIVGPPGTVEMVGHLMAALGPDIGYRMAHHRDLTAPPAIEVLEVEDGDVAVAGDAVISCAPTDHKPVHPSIGFRFDHAGRSVVVAGDTVPCPGLDRLCAGAGALVHTAIRKDIITAIGVPRLVDTLDYHSSVEEAAQTAARNGVRTLVLTHHVPRFPPGGGAESHALATAHFDGSVVVGDDLDRIEVPGSAVSEPSSTDY